MSGIDTAMPDVRKKFNYHAAWNQHDHFWREDFQQLADCGFDLLRWQMPWSIVEPQRGKYRWDLLDPKVELANKLGMELFYPIVHFNLPAWLAKDGEHAVFAQDLSDQVAEYTHRLLTRYKFKLVIPIVEIQMDAFQRGRIGNWQPHLKSQSAFEAIYANLLDAFRAGAKVAREHRATVFCSEPAPAIQTVIELRDYIDVAGIDLYPHMHKRRSLIGWLRFWSKGAGLPLCLSEFGIPESYDPVTRVDSYRKFFEAGIDDHRVTQARLLREALDQARREHISIPYGGWYPGTGNIGWGRALTRDRSRYDCDRAGLVDLSRQPDGTLKRVLCHDLVTEVLGLTGPKRRVAAA